MSSSITNNKIKKQSLNNELFINKIFTSLNDIEKKSKSLSIKNIAIRENIRSIKLKEKKIEKISQTILNKKEELKLLKELFSLKREKNMNIKDIFDSYVDFIISSNDILNNKINALFQKEMSINPKQKYINKILGNDNHIENNYDYIYKNINKPIDITKFLINPKKKNNNDGRMIENGGREKLDRYIINEKENKRNNNINSSNNKNNTSNYTNLYQSKKNRISSSSSYEKISNGIKIEKISNSFKNKNSKAKNRNNSNELAKIDENYKKYEIFLSPKNSINENNNFIINKLSIGKDYKKKEKNMDILNYDEYNRKDIDANCRNMNKNIKNFAQTDINDFNNYNLKPNNKLEKARIIFQRLLYKLKNTNKLYFTGKDNNCLKNFFLNVLNSKYFLKKALSIIFECNEIYGPNNKRTITETVHDSEFLSKLNNYEDSEENCENNIGMFEKGLEEIKKVTNETKQLKDKISKFAYKINFAE